ncbi:LppU/SCO3897 family protein [Plantactinospora sp. DSM 117369]
MSTYPPPGYGPGEPSHDPRYSGQSGGYGGPAGGGSGYPQSSSGGYPQSSSGSYPPSSGSYPQSSAGSYPPPSSSGAYSQSSEPYPQASGYPSSGADPSAPSSPAGPAPQFGTPVPPKKSKAPLVVGIVLGVVLLCCGGSTAAYLWAGDDGTDPSNVAAGEQTPSPKPSTKTTPRGKASPTPEEESIEGNLDQFKKGDCLTIDEATDEVEEASCGSKGALKVLLRKDGTTSESACESTDYTQYLYQDGTIGTLQDFILCVGPAR